jgi:hypothetical protein
MPDEITQTGVSDAATDTKTPAETSPSKLTAEQVAALEVPLTIDGETTNRTVADLMRDAQKQGAADNSLREAREQVKTNQAAIGLYKNLMAAKGGDQDALKTAIVSMGYEEGAIDELLEAMAGGGEEEPKKGTLPAPTPQLDPATAQQVEAFFNVAKDQGLDAGQLAQALSAGVLAQGKKNIRTSIGDALKNDPEAAKMLEKGTDSDAMTEIVESVLSRHLGETKQPLSRGAINHAVGTTRKLVQSLLKDAAKAQSQGPDILSLGGPQAHLEDLGPDHLPEKPAARPPITDVEGYDSFMTHRLREIAREIDSRAKK